MILCKEVDMNTSEGIYIQGSDVVRKLFLKLGFLYTVQMDSEPDFHGPFQELLKEFGITYTLSSLYNPEWNGLEEYYMGIAKLLLKKIIDS